MATLSIEEVARVALTSGWSGRAAVIATAIAMGESGGRTDARGDTTIQTGTWGPSIGLWQIRSIKSQRGTGGERDELANLDPFVNGKHAYSISGGGSNWRPWSVYTSGRYLTFMAQAEKAVANPAASVNGQTGGSVVNAADTGGGLFSNPFADLMNPKLWLRLGMFILGGILLLFGLWKLTGVGDAAVGVVKGVVQARTGVSL